LSKIKRKEKNTMKRLTAKKRLVLVSVMKKKSFPPTLRNCSYSWISKYFTLGDKRKVIGIGLEYALNNLSPANNSQD